MKKLLLILLFIPSLSFADPWSQDDIYREVAFQAVTIIDWGQTRDIAKNTDKFFEHNPFLGNSPSINSVDTYFISAIIIHVIVSNNLSSEYRKYFQYISIGIESNSAIKNAAHGIHVNF